MRRWSNSVLWGALLFFAAAYFLTFLARSQSVPIRPRLHMGLQDPANKTLVLEMWCDELTVDHNNNGTYCWHDGVAVIMVPHASNFAWLPLEAK